MKKLLMGVGALLTVASVLIVIFTKSVYFAAIMISIVAVVWPIHDIFDSIKNGKSMSFGKGILVLVIVMFTLWGVWGYAVPAANWAWNKGSSLAGKAGVMTGMSFEKGDSKVQVCYLAFSEGCLDEITETTDLKYTAQYSQFGWFKKNFPFLSAPVPSLGYAKELVSDTRLSCRNLYYLNTDAWNSQLDLDNDTEGLIEWVIEGSSRFLGGDEFADKNTPGDVTQYILGNKIMPCDPTKIKGDPAPAQTRTRNRNRSSNGNRNRQQNRPAAQDTNPVQTPEAAKKKDKDWDF